VCERDRERERERKRKKERQTQKDRYTDNMMEEDNSLLSVVQVPGSTGK
jgi:hypothetical protein